MRNGVASYDSRKIKIFFYFKVFNISIFIYIYSIGKNVLEMLKKLNFLKLKRWKLAVCKTECKNIDS